MSASVLVTGILFRPPEQRTSSTGRKYVKATLRAAAADNSTSEFWDLLAFSETAAAELLRLTENDSLAVQGGLKVEIYAPEGKPPRISRTVFVYHVLPLRSPPKQKKAKPPAVPVSARASSSLDRVNILPDAGGDLDDDIPF
jgi:hypothetical protein